MSRLYSRKLLHFVTCIACFATSLLLTGNGLRSLVPEPIVPGISVKLDWMARHGDEYDTLFIGSSRTHRQLIPAEFDTAMREAGQTTRSFNLGGDGMRPPEDTYILERVLAQRTRPLRYLIVESNAMRIGLEENDLGTVRAIYWHDLRRLAALWYRVWAPHYVRKEHFSKRAETIWRNFRAYTDNLSHGFLRTIHPGGGHTWLRGSLGLAPLDFPDTLGPHGDGYRLQDADPLGLRGDDLRSYEIRMRRALFADDAGRDDPEDSASQAELRCKLALAQRHGATLVLVTPPVVSERIFTPHGTGWVYLDFSEIERQPTLFEPRHRSDAGHTNALGSKLYTRALAAALLALPPAP